MNATLYSPAFIRKRKFLMMLPVLITPFVVLLFFILGGGKGIKEISSGNVHQGLNTQLPDAHFGKKKDKDKMGLYEASNQDSAKWKMLIKNDPYRLDSNKLNVMAFDRSRDFQTLIEKTEKTQMVVPGFPGAMKSNKEKEVMEKLALLKKQIEKPVTSSSGHTDLNTGVKESSAERASRMLREMSRASETDPQIAELNRMLDKVMAIQHPDMIKDSVRKMNENKGMTNTDFHIATHNGDNAIPAVIPERQTLVSGATIRLRISDSFFIGKICVPEGQLIYGTVSLSNERLRILIKSLRTGNSILPVSLEAYDLDGLAGIYVPGSITRDVSKESFDQGLNGMGISAFDQSIGAQAATAGIQAAKTLISRKVKLIRISVQDGYQVLLRESH